MMRAMLLALCACALPSAFAFGASVRPFCARGSALQSRGVLLSKRSPEVACALNYDPDRMRDVRTIDNYIYILYDIVFEGSLPEFVTQDDVTEHFTSCATEFNTTREIHKLLKGDATKAINAVADEANRKKDTLIAEFAAAEAAQIAAAAAQASALAFEWMPGVNFGLEIAAFIAFTTATALEFEAESYENSVIDYISKMNNEVVKQPGMETVQTWQTAVALNGAFYPRLESGTTLNVQRAIMQAIPTGIQQHELGYVDADGYKAYIKTVGEFVYTNQDILDEYERLLASIDNSTTPQEIKDAKVEIANSFPGFNPTEAAKYVDLFMDGMSSILAYKDYKKWYKTRRSVADASDLDIAPVDEVGDVDPALDAGVGEAAEESWWAKSGALGDAIAGIGAVAIVVFTGFEIRQTVDLDKELTSTISQVKGNLTAYYDDIIKNAPVPNSSKTNAN